MKTIEQLDRRPPLTIKCPQCGATDVKLLRHWNDRPRPAPAFDPTHQCARCSFRWIYRSPKEKIRSFLLDD